MSAVGVSLSAGDDGSQRIAQWTISTGGSWKKYGCTDRTIFLKGTNFQWSEWICLLNVFLLLCRYDLSLFYNMALF